MIPAQSERRARNAARRTLSALMLAAWACGASPAQVSKGGNSAAKPTLSEEDKQILRNRELLENLELLGNFEQIRYLEFFAANTPADPVSKPPKTITSNKDKAGKNGKKKS